MKTFWKTTVMNGAALLLMVPAASAAQPEELLGISLNSEKKEITLDVVSTGCTRKEGFQFELKDATLTVMRKERDTCKAMPGKISLTFSLKEVGLDPNKPFRIGNTFIANEFTANMLRKP